MNSGKLFEQQIKASIPSRCFYHRLKDSTGTFSGGSKLRFSSENPFDALLFDCANKVLYAFELKSTKAKSFSFENPFADDSQPRRMIHAHQIRGLLSASEYENVCAGFIFNFRDEDALEERSYFQRVGDFITMISNGLKVSFNEADLRKNNAVVIEGRKKRTRYIWDIEKLLRQMNERK